MDSAILFFGILPWFWKVSKSLSCVLEAPTAVLSSMNFLLLLQKSGEFLLLVGLNAENEILHTLSFLAGVMIWSQVCKDLPCALLEDK